MAATRRRTPPRPLPGHALNRLVRVVGSPAVGYAVAVHGLLGTDELQTPNLALARHLCRAVRFFVRNMPAARQRRVFDPDEVRCVLPDCDNPIFRRT